MWWTVGYMEKQFVYDKTHFQWVRNHVRKSRSQVQVWIDLRHVSAVFEHLYWVHDVGRQVIGVRLFVDVLLLVGAREHHDGVDCACVRKNNVRFQRITNHHRPLQIHFRYHEFDAVEHALMRFPQKHGFPSCCHGDARYNGPGAGTPTRGSQAEADLAFVARQVETLLSKRMHCNRMLTARFIQWWFPGGGGGRCASGLGVYLGSGEGVPLVYTPFHTHPSPLSPYPRKNMGTGSQTEVTSHTSVDRMTDSQV